MSIFTSRTSRENAEKAAKDKADLEAEIKRKQLLGSGAIAIVLTAVLLGANYVYKTRLKRFSSTAEIPLDFLNGRRTLFGKVVSVGDGDNFRLFHTPGGRLAGWGWLRPIPTLRAASRAGTLPIRLAGVDAPESAHFGNPAQPYGPEALKWLCDTLLGRRLRVTLWTRDQYNRAVSSVHIWQWGIFRKDVSLEMVKAGLATVYIQKGAQYGGIKDKLDRAEYLAK